MHDHWASDDEKLEAIDKFWQNVASSCGLSRPNRWGKTFGC